MAVELHRPSPGNRREKGDDRNWCLFELHSSVLPPVNEDLRSVSASDSQKNCAPYQMLRRLKHQILTQVSPQLSAKKRQL